MSTQESSVPLVFSFPECIIRDLLDGRGCRNICRNTAEIILMKTHNEGTLCYVQLPGNILAAEVFDSIRNKPGIRDLEFARTLHNKPLTVCILWDWTYWRNSSEAWLQKKARMAYEKEQEDILKANMRRIKKAILKKMALTDGQAAILAHSWMREGNMEAIQWVGVEKLFTTIKEI